MSSKGYKLLSLLGSSVHTDDVDELERTQRALLDETIPGLCFSPYMEGQKPGDQLSAEQIRMRMEIIAPYTKAVRSFSCTEGNELIPQIAKDYGLRTLVGAWIGENRETNEKEIAGLINLAKKGFVDVAAVGNEVMLRKELSEDELIFYIKQVRQELPAHIPVGYVDAYYQFEEHPRIAEACDVILTNCYPFWEACPLEFSLPYIKDMYRRAQKAGKGKPVIITETGWPNIGTAFHGAIPSRENAIKYFNDVLSWVKEEGIELYYFSSFDETWKIEKEGDVGAYWGLWDKNGIYKY
ncbi:glycosyl hydrolase family 17 protein [Gracilinema caldarium]|uniref:glycoside hydrolase family 17 protein n=1 Tax=Gracilinema caldarium TaxID=215591 RepID=UPI0026F26CD7|nr:glycosyl hydrolase family 17 protein [Gracilinema caldarium]